MALAPTSEEDALKDAAPKRDDEEVKEEVVVATTTDADLEDGEIEDDDDDEEEAAAAGVVGAAAATTPEHATAAAVISPANGGGVGVPSPTGGRHRDLELPAPGVGEKHKRKHLTEAERSVMKLHKLERMEREKREKYRREQMHVPEPVDDYAVSLEKALAKVLKKETPPAAAADGDEKYDDEAKLPRARKRKKKDKHKKMKRSKQDSPKNPEDEIERAGSPEAGETGTTAGGRSEGESSDTDASSSTTATTTTTTTTPAVANEKQQQQQHHEQLRKRAALTRELRRETAKNRRERRDRSRERQLEGGRQCFKKLRKRNVGICLYYLQGKCNDEHCQYSHDCVQPLKLELCKFYLLDCCAKGDKCLYMHADFPCKYYHTGIPCPFGDECKFAHGGPLADSVRQILFKHIETAPKEILGNFPRLSRENAHMMITQAQKNLELRKQREKEEAAAAGGGNHHHVAIKEEYDGGGDGQATPSADKLTSNERKEKRNRPSRWQDPEPESQPPAAAASSQPNLLGFGLGGGAFKDQDMRINSNGDVDMRSLHHGLASTDIGAGAAAPSIFAATPPPPMLGLNLLHMQQAATVGLAGMLNPSGIIDALKTAAVVDIEQYKMDACGDAATTTTTSEGLPTLGPSGQDVDLRVPPPNQTKDVDIRLETSTLHPPSSSNIDDEEDALQIVVEEEDIKKEAPTLHDGNVKLESFVDDDGGVYGLAKVQRDLFARIQQQQKVHLPGGDGSSASGGGAGESRDDEQDQNIDWYSDDEDDHKLTIEHVDEDDELLSTAVKKEEKSDSPAEPPEPTTNVVERLGDLSNIDIAHVSKLLSTIKESVGSDAAQKDPRSSSSSSKPRDPRLLRQQQQQQPEVKSEPMTIYETSQAAEATHGGSSSSSRLGRADVDLRMGMPFKALGNYTPATEIDASVSAHPAMAWRVFIVEIPKPDYAGLRLSAADAQTSGDPRLRKIFRLSTEEKDSPASPPLATTSTTANPTPRVDPRRKRVLEAAATSTNNDPKDAVTGGGGMIATYAQQMSALQASPFYQSLTSNQKLMLNQELASRQPAAHADPTGVAVATAADPIISAMLASLGLQAAVAHPQHHHHHLANTQQPLPPPHTAQHAGQALTILNSLATNNPLLTGATGGGGGGGVNLGVAPPNIGQGLLGPAPTHLQDFGGGGGGFDPRNAGPGILGNPPFGDFPGGGGGGGGNRANMYNDEEMYYDNALDDPRIANTNPNRDRANRRGRNNNNNNRNRNNFFRHNNRNNRNRNSPS